MATIRAAATPGPITWPSPADDGTVDPNSAFARYELLERLGKGSYGTVYKGRDLRTNELLAIKARCAPRLSSLKSESARSQVIPLTDGEEVDSIAKEIAMLRECCHPNIVRYHAALQGSDCLWIVMEYCGGGSVSDIIAVGAAPLEEPQVCND